MPHREERFGHREERTRRAPRQVPEAVTPPSEESIEILISMGFERDSAISVLQSTNNNVQAAATILLDGRI